jgi:hypothetical protein
VRDRTRGLPLQEGAQDRVTYQSVTPAPQGFLFADFDDLAQETVPDFGLHLDAVELLIVLQLFTTSRGE